jgi:hypothetical protein
MKSGALYKGEWRDDKPHGLGILYSGENEIVETRFEKGTIPNGRIKMMIPDGSYYEGMYSNHVRHGKGTCYYPNGDIYDGEWVADERVGRGKMRFNTGLMYQGQFIKDQADGIG